jgi:membrane-associated phospholipid phosphatase
MMYRQQIARWISRAGHPFILPLVALTVVTLQVVPPLQAVALVAIMIATTTVPILLFTRRQIQRKRWSDYDVSVRQDRYLLYPLGLLTLSASALVFWMLGAPAFMLRGIAGGAALLFVAMLINLTIKISLHMALASLCGIVILALNLWLGIIACSFAIANGWSRVVLRRHTLTEVVVGGLLGIVVGVILVLVS